MTAPFVPDDEDEFTELLDGDFPRVDLVGKAANGVPRFLIAKSAQHPYLLEASMVRALITKASATDLSQVPREDLLRQVASGSAEQKRAALLELGTRSAHGLSEPEPAAPAPANKPMLDDDGNEITQVTDTKPLPSGEVGTPAAAIAKQARRDIAEVRAAHARGHLAEDEAVEQIRRIGAMASLSAMGQIRKDRAEEVAATGVPIQSSMAAEVRASTLQQSSGNPVSVQSSDWSYVASPEAQAANITPPVPDDEELEIVGLAVAKAAMADRAVRQGALTSAGAEYAKVRAVADARRLVRGLRAAGR